MKISRAWAMPNGSTFNIKPIRSLIEMLFITKGLMKVCVAIDPFVNKSPFKDRCYTNDLDPDIRADCHLDALDFLKSIDSSSADIVLYDPPYSPRQVSECYKKLGRTVNMETTQASFWSNIKKQIARITKNGGHVVSCGWNSSGIGKGLGYEIIEILLVAHGGRHHDTIITVEQRKLPDKH